MKNTIFNCLLILFGLTFSKNLIAQAPKSGTVTGQVNDVETGEPVAYATVTLYNAETNQLVTGGLTEDNGSFAVKDVPQGVYKAEISFIGYDKKEIDAITISSEQPVVSLGSITLGINSEQIDAVVVEREGPTVRYEVDKKVYDASKLKAAEGGTAKDVLEQIPSITVTSDQSIQLRGSGNVRVLVNGKPSSFSINTLLQQIPQKNIKDIEIITNPSAKYDAEGEVGIINIILKDNDLEGFTGGTSLSWGTENKWNLGGNVGYKVKKWNLTASYNYNRFRDNFFRDTERTMASYPNNLQLSNEARNFSRGGHFARMGVDYYLDDANTFFLSGSLNPGRDKSDGDVISNNVYTELFNGTENIPQNFYNYIRTSDGNGTRDGYSYTGSFQHVFDKNMSHNLLVDFNHNTGDESDYSYYNIDEFIPLNNPNHPISGFSDSDNRINDSKTTTLSADYTNPFDGKKKLELGYKSILEDRNEDFTVLYDDVVFNNSTGQFNFNQDIHAGYVTYQSQLNKKVGLKGGLRAEYTSVNSVAKGGQNASYVDDYLEWFPSASASFQQNENLQFSTSYSRRVTRPRGRQLNPFADRTDPNNQFVGNNELRPSFTNSLEFGFNKFWKTVGWDGSLYYRQVKDQIQFRNTFEEDRNIVSFYNLTEQRVTGLETTFDIKPQGAKWYSLRLSGNYNYSTVKENDSDVQLANNKFSLLSGNIMNNFRFEKGFSGQLTLNYQGSMATYIGQVDPMWGINLNVSQQIMDKKGSVYIRANDLFNTYGLNVDIADDSRKQHLTLDWPSQMAFVGFNYNFGNLKSPARRKLERREDNGGDNTPNIGL